MTTPISSRRRSVPTRSARHALLLAPRAVSATAAPRNIAMQLLPGTTIAMPSPYGDGTYGLHAASARASRGARARCRARGRRRSRSRGRCRACRCRRRTPSTRRPTPARGRRPLLAAEHARVGMIRLNAGTTISGAREHAEQLRVELMPRLGAEQPAGLERRQQIRGVQADAAGDVRRHDVAGQVAGRDHAVHHLRHRAERLRRRDVGLAGHARGDEAHQHGERHRDDARPTPGSGTATPSRATTIGVEHDKAGREPPLGCLDGGDALLVRGFLRSEDRAEAGTRGARLL